MCHLGSYHKLTSWLSQSDFKSTQHYSKPKYKITRKQSKQMVCGKH